MSASASRRDRPWLMRHPLQESQCACGEPSDSTQAFYITDAGFPEFADTCKHCMPEDVAAKLSAYYRRGFP